MLNEKKLTNAELNKREELIMKMKKNKRALVQKYGSDAEQVMYGRATNIAKKQAESMENDKLKEMVKTALQNPKAADLNKDGKLSDYEEKRGAAIEKNLDEIDINDPVLMKMRAAKMKAANAGDDGNDKFFAKNAARLGKLKALKDKRAQIMSDMEQEAELEGGPIADRYGDMLNKIDKAIAMLQGQGEWGPEKDVDITAQEIGKRAAMIGLEEGSSTEEKRIAMSAIKKLAKYRGVSDSEAKADLLRAVKELGDLKEEFDLDIDQEGGEQADTDKSQAGILDAEAGLGLEEDLDLGHQDNEPHMLKAELYRIGKYAMELYQMVDGFEGEGEVDFPAWWQAKITTSMNNMVGAKHYLDFEIKEPAIDAVVDRISDVAPEMEIDGLGVSELLDPTPPLVLSKANSKINNVATMAKALLDLYGELKQKEQTTNFESDSNFKNVLYYLNKAAKPQTDKEAKPDVVDNIEEIGMFHDPKGYEKPKPDPKDKIYTKKYKGDGVYDIFKNDEKIKTIKGGEGEANAYINQLKRELEEAVNTRHIEDHEYMAAKIQKAMNDLDKKSEDYESKLYRLQQARKANNKSDFKTAMKIMKPFLAPVEETQYASLAEKLAKQLKSK
jgi:hypothetical protein